MEIEDPREASSPSSTKKSSSRQTSSEEERLRKEKKKKKAGDRPEKCLPNQAMTRLWRHSEHDF
jgi:hypothetical protein